MWENESCFINVSSTGLFFYLKGFQQFYHLIFPYCAQLIGIGEWNTGTSGFPFLNMPAFLGR